MKIKTEIPFLVTAAEEPNIGIMICRRDSAGLIICKKESLQHMLEEHFDKKITVISIDKISFYPFKLIAIVTDTYFDADNRDDDQEWEVELNETWIYKSF